MALQQDTSIEKTIVNEEEDLKRKIFEAVKNTKEWKDHASSHKGAELIFLEEPDAKRDATQHNQTEAGASIYGQKQGESVEAFCRCGGLFEVELDGSKINPRVHFKSPTVYEQGADSAGIPSYGRAGNAQTSQSGIYGPKQNENQSYLK